jgi:hypothetical protein
LRKNRAYQHIAELDSRERRLVRIAQLRQQRTPPDQAVELYMEEFGVCRATYFNDRKEFVKRLRGATDDEVQAYRTAQLEELDELREVAKDATISKSKRVELILAILDREIDLVGSNAPSRSQSTSVNINADVVDPATLPEYRRFLHATRYMNAAKKEKMFQIIHDSGLNVREAEVVEVPTSSPLWGDQEPKQLPEGDE